MDKIGKGPARLAGVGTLVLAFLIGLPGLASAATTTEGAIRDGFSQLQGLVTGVLALALFGIVVAVLGILMGVRWLRKGSST